MRKEIRRCRQAPQWKQEDERPRPSRYPGRAWRARCGHCFQPREPL